MFGGSPESISYLCWTAGLIFMYAVDLLRIEHEVIICSFCRMACSWCLICAKLQNICTHWMACLGILFTRSIQLWTWTAQGKSLLLLLQDHAFGMLVVVGKGWYYSQQTNNLYISFFFPSFFFFSLRKGDADGCPGLCTVQWKFFFFFLHIWCFI